MEVGLAVGGAFISSALNVLFDRLAPQGNKYFFELTSRSLFGRVPNTSEGTIENLFLMHDLVNDLAQIAFSKLCIRLEESQGSHVLEKGRHLSYSMGYGDFEELIPLYKLEQLRTLLPTCIDQLKNCYHPLSKRVLHSILSDCRFLEELPLQMEN
ncbi:hypothetical protein MTR67_049497 [Solanum verrucosum]|uniref:Disease resistance protein winged helix domain-containing protein n=1 Tax=Solanum verrucosum TaxID=315347 RepID=A0AAF0V109_SOLVR|nr:hypothetical protein MTR67_049497 [Solanum verrucosum]